MRFIFLNLQDFITTPIRLLVFPSCPRASYRALEIPPEGTKAVQEQS